MLVLRRRTHVATLGIAMGILIARRAGAQTSASPAPMSMERASAEEQSPPPSAAPSDEPTNTPSERDANASTPPSPAPHADLPVPPAARSEPPTAPVITVIGDAPLTAASSQVVRDRDLQLRPRTRPGDILEVAPGLIVVQHAGGGKANQYFLRGFDADHGTDIAFSLDDVPINMVSHGHGQGYSDPHFLIPELIDRIEVREGPYFAQDGDFATAGAINLRLRDRVAHSFVSLEDTLVANPVLGAGMLSNLRFLGVARTEAGPLHGYVAAEVAHVDGPFVNPQDFNRYNALGHWTLRVGDRTDLTLTVSTYAGAWNASGQIPAHLVGESYMGRTFTRFDSVDPSEGGVSSRHQATLALHSRLSPDDDLRVMLYVAAYRFALFSNFTLYLDDPVHGDQIEQDDSRTMTGFRATYRHIAHAGSWHFITTVGTSLRYDDIENGLHHTQQRMRLETRVADHVQETAIGVFGEEQIVPHPAVRLVLGMRVDDFQFGVEDRRSGVTTPDPDRNGSAQAMAFSPKATLVVSPVRGRRFNLDLFANFGRGFHSNDARGAIIRATPDRVSQCADSRNVPAGVLCPVTPLTPAMGYELGVRARLFRRLDLSLAAWMLDLENETVWVGDEGTTEVAGATRRLGITAEARAQIMPWLWADADVSFVNAVYRQNAGNGDAVALAPPWTLAAGLSVLHPLGLYGALRLRAIGERPADPAGDFHADGFAIVNASVGFRRGPIDIGLFVENLLNSQWREAQFEADSRVPGEPLGCPSSTPNCHTDIHFTPGTPFSATLRIAARW